MLLLHIQPGIGPGKPSGLDTITIGITTTGTEGRRRRPPIPVEDYGRWTMAPASEEWRAGTEPPKPEIGYPASYACSTWIIFRGYVAFNVAFLNEPSFAEVASPDEEKKNLVQRLQNIVDEINATAKTR